MFYDKKAFPFTEALETHWRFIRDEYDTLQPNQLLKAPWETLHNQSWEIYSLYGRGRPFKIHCKNLPRTTQLIESIPGLYNAGFSVLGPQTHILPHVGYTSEVLRCHLGIVVPLGCGLRVGAETRVWQQGECMIFDDMYEHEAWNKSDQSRVVLIIDFLKQEYAANIG